MICLEFWRGRATQIAADGHAASTPSGHADHREPLLPCHRDCPRNVPRAARCRNRDKHVAGAAKAEDLPFENLLVAIVIGHPGHHRSVGRRARTAAREFSSNVLGIGGAAAIAREKQLVPAAQSGGGRIDNGEDSRGESGVVVAARSASWDRVRYSRIGFTGGPAMSHTRVR